MLNPSATVLDLQKLPIVLLGFFSALQLTAFLWPKSYNVQNGESFDFVVIGCGGAGSVLANRLSENKNFTVLCIEAGGEPPIDSLLVGLFPLLPQTKYDWNYYTENDGYSSAGHKDDVLEMTAGKMLGGSTSLNHAIFNRGFPSDYNNWAKIANDNSWNYTNIHNYFFKIEKLKDPEILKSDTKKYHGLDGAIATTREHHDAVNKYLEALKEVGYTVVLDKINNMFTYSEPLLMIDQIRQSAAYGYVHPLKNKRNNVKFALNTLVTKISFDKNKTATGVTALTESGKEITINARKEVISAAGVFNSPQLLMLSGIGPKDDLQKLNISVLSDVPVGYNMQDHPTALVALSVEPILLPSLPLPPTEFPVPVVTGYIALDKNQSYPDYEAFNLVFQNQAAFLQICSYVFTYNDEICNNIYKAGKHKEMLVAVPSFLHPNSRGRVQLRSANPKDSPIIKSGFFSEESDIEKMTDIIEDFLRIENSTLFKQTGGKLIDPKLSQCSGLEFRSKEYWKCYILTMAASLYSYSSTCSMGSVVDSQLNVIGVNGLRVVDASVIPSITSGDVGVPTYVIAEKAADMIKQKHNND